MNDGYANTDVNVEFDLNLATTVSNALYHVFYFAHLCHVSTTDYYDFPI